LGPGVSDRDRLARGVDRAQLQNQSLTLANNAAPATKNSTRPPPCPPLPLACGPTGRESRPISTARRPTLPFPVSAEPVRNMPMRSCRCQAPHQHRARKCRPASRARRPRRIRHPKPQIGAPPRAAANTPPPGQREVGDLDDQEFGLACRPTGLQRFASTDQHAALPNPTRVFGPSFESSSFAGPGAMRQTVPAVASQGFPPPPQNWPILPGYPSRRCRAA